MIWCASTEIYLEIGQQHQDIESFEKAIDENDPMIAPSMLYAYAAILEGVPFANGAPNLALTRQFCDYWPLSAECQLAAKISKLVKR